MGKPFIAPLCNECLVRGRTTCRAKKYGFRCPIEAQSGRLSETADKRPLEQAEPKAKR